MSDPSFEEWLVDNPQFKDIVEILRAKSHDSMSDEIERYVMDSAKRNAQQFEATKRWLLRSRGLSHRIKAGVAHESEYVLFWVFLYGLISELYAKEDQNRELTMQIPWRRPFMEALDDLYNCLSDSERSFVKFMRHNHVHILIDYPWQTIKAKDGSIVRVKDASEPDAIRNAEEILERYDGNQPKAARDFVSKTSEKIDQLVRTFEQATAT